MSNSFSTVRPAKNSAQKTEAQQIFHFPTLPSTLSPILVSLEGNIGAGKSTILEQLAARLDQKGLSRANHSNSTTNIDADSVNTGWIFLREPVHIWDEIKDAEGNTILSKFYANPSKYAFAFQIMAYTTRLHELKRLLRENPNCRGVVCERSLEADKHIFAKMLHDDNLIEDVMYNIYERFFNEYEDMFKVSGVVYIDADPEICHQRIIKRSRDGETAISLEYLRQCRDYHTAWLMNKGECDETPYVKLLHLNTNRVATFDLEKSNDVGHEWLNQIEAFLNNLSNELSNGLNNELGSGTM